MEICLAAAYLRGALPHSHAHVLEGDGPGAAAGISWCACVYCVGVS